MTLKGILGPHICTEFGGHSIGMTYIAKKTKGSPNGRDIPDVIKTGIPDGNEVVLSNPCIPVLLKNIKRGIIILHASKSVFVDNI